MASLHPTQQVQAEEGIELAASPAPAIAQQPVEASAEGTRSPAAATAWQCATTQTNGTSLAEQAPAHAPGVEVVSPSAYLDLLRKVRQRPECALRRALVVA